MILQPHTTLSTGLRPYFYQFSEHPERFHKSYPEFKTPEEHRLPKLVMARRSHLLYLLILSSTVICCSGTAIGTKTDVSSIFKALSTTLNLKQVKAFQFQVLVPDQGVVHSLSNTGESAYKSILVNVRSSIPETPSIIVSCNSLNGLQMLLPTLLSTNSLSKGFEKPVKVSVALPLSLIKSSNSEQRRHVVNVLHHMRKSKSFLVVDESVDGDWNNPDELIHSIILKANLVISLLSHAHVPIILSIKTSVLPTAAQVSALNGNFPHISSILTSIFVEVSPTLKLSSHRELLTQFKHDSLYPPSTVPTSPVYNPTTPTNIPPYNPTPAIVTIPGANPVTPPYPYTTPVPVTQTGNPVAPIPDAGTQPVTTPVTNPVTTYPPPLTGGGVPSTTSPVTTPASTPGQSWCIAKNGAPEAALQSALDYACGIGGADCATIQDGSTCFNPNTLENHASYAFNSYYQKNPTATSCDFGGAAVIVNSNPSSGTCVYPSSATTAAPSIIPPATTGAPSMVPPATTASTSGDTGAGTGTGTGSSYGSPPFVLNTSSSPTGSATGGYGFESPPIITAPPSGSAHVQTAMFGFVVFTTSLAMAVLLGV